MSIWAARYIFWCCFLFHINSEYTKRQTLAKKNRTDLAACKYGEIKENKMVKTERGGVEKTTFRVGGWDFREMAKRTVIEMSVIILWNLFFLFIIFVP